MVDENKERSKEMIKEKRMVSDFLYPDLTYKIRGALYKVHRVLGSGHKESVYHMSLKQEFAIQNIQFESEKRLVVFYEGIKVGIYQPDFIVDNKVIVELKAVPILSIQTTKQLSYYLKGTSYKLGLLVNFDSDSLVIRRIIWSKCQPSQLKSA